jgi:hypothetical protein
LASRVPHSQGEERLRATAPRKPQTPAGPIGDAAFVGELFGAGSSSDSFPLPENSMPDFLSHAFIAPNQTAVCLKPSSL